ncbi:hypothetical protein EDD66_10510 [Mobilisporobacter senegalensis]|uniref:Uncharacterized protein n=1 Tax=Mobilisporobacter senegalensis TaxID=1329262 RepID=A0A3N1XSB0_9FIRM|nr:hypothetical protein EDD66_10510 [Mobilisporobacter senegalensis]
MQSKISISGKIKSEMISFYKSNGILHVETVILMRNSGLEIFFSEKLKNNQLCYYKRT